MLASAVCALLLVPGLRAQTIPELGAGRLIGSAGLETLLPPGMIGLPPNAAAIGAHDNWSLGLGSANNSDFGIAELSVTAARRIGRVGLGVRVTSRHVANLFDDPALNDGPDLRVEFSEYTVGARLEVLPGFRVGLSGVLGRSQVLSNSAVGAGLRFGVDVHRPWIRAGLTYGEKDVALEWTTSSGTVRTQGTRRLGVGLGTPRFRWLGLDPALVVEWNRDDGLNPDSWLRASASVGALNGAVRVLLGAAESASHPLASYREVGAQAGVDWIQIQAGVRFAEREVQGNSLTFGVGMRGRGN